MEPCFAFVGGDRRMEYAQELLGARGYSITELADPKATHLVLPWPALESPGRILHGPTVNEVLLYAGGKTILAGSPGIPGEYLFHKAAKILDYASDEALLAGNAEITAEGALALAMERLPVALARCPVLVVGWGRIGQLLARKLAALGAHVTVSARKARDLGLIEALGFQSEETMRYCHGLSGYRVIFNTVPAQTFSSEQSAQIPARCLYVELASTPGLDPQALPPEQFLSGQALPGKYAPETAGILLGKAILRLVRQEEARKEAFRT